MLGTHICPVTCIHSNHPHAHVHTCSAHMCAHAHKPSAHTCTLSTHVYTPNIHVYTACTQHTHVTHMLGTHIYTHAQHTCTHPACAHCTHMLSTYTYCTHAQQTRAHTHTHTHMLSAHQTPSPCASHNCSVQCRMYLMVRGTPVRWKSMPAFPPQERPAH